jgi:hypothetical protein
MCIRIFKIFDIRCSGVFDFSISLLNDILSSVSLNIIHENWLLSVLIEVGLKDSFLLGHVRFEYLSVEGLSRFVKCSKIRRWQKRFRQIWLVDSLVQMTKMLNCDDIFVPNLCLQTHLGSMSKSGNDQLRPNETPNKQFHDFHDFHDFLCFDHRPMSIGKVSVPQVFYSVLSIGRVRFIFFVEFGMLFRSSRGILKPISLKRGGGSSGFNQSSILSSNGHIWSTRNFHYSQEWNGQHQ